ncbi:MAG TPA: hypothetical protein VEX39_11570 [Thermoleophilaceae bacterium]|nr:hypothetical protein [Thermoleophilaceae bacterium]
MSQEGAIATEWQALVEDVCSGVLSLEAHFQPIVDLRRGIVCGYEALSRPVAPGERPESRLDPSIAAQVAVRVDEFDRPVGLLVRRGQDIEELGG